MKKKKIEKAFLPVSKDEMVERGWYYYDFLVVTADAYIDHPSFGTAIIARVLEHEGYRVAVLAQPDWHSADAFRAMGRPRYGVMIGGGNIDSMVAHYTAAKKRRTQDLYSPGSRMGLRPDRPTIVYANRCREAFGDVPIVVGGLEASLRRFAHYDYWDDKVRRALIFDAQADLLVYGMGEYATREIARRLSKGEKADTLTDIRGTAFVTRTPEVCAFDHVECPSYEEVCGDKHAYALATKLEYEEHDPFAAKRSGRRTGVTRSSSIRPRCRFRVRSSTRSPSSPTCARCTRCTTLSAASPPSRRCAFPSRTTAGASADATSARWRSIRGA